MSFVALTLYEGQQLFSFCENKMRHMIQESMHLISDHDL